MDIEHRNFVKLFSEIRFQILDFDTIGELGTVLFLLPVDGIKKGFWWIDGEIEKSLGRITRRYIIGEHRYSNIVHVLSTENQIRKWNAIDI